ncbi:MAG: DUF1801 domain-containing protein [Gammaproteobacteria bacterium]
MSGLFRFPEAKRQDPAVESWMREHAGHLEPIARRWFDVMHDCGEDVRELIHDGHPVACAGDAAFGYVDAFKRHVNVGFFKGAELADPAGLLEGSGRFMRHVKLGPGHDIDAPALIELVATAYADMQQRLQAGW